MEGYPHFVHDDGTERSVDYGPATDILGREVRCESDSECSVSDMERCVQSECRAWRGATGMFCMVDDGIVADHDKPIVYGGIACSGEDSECPCVDGVHLRVHFPELTPDPMPSTRDSPQDDVLPLECVKGKCSINGHIVIHHKTNEPMECVTAADCAGDIVVVLDVPSWLLSLLVKVRTVLRRLCAGRCAGPRAAVTVLSMVMFAVNIVRKRYAEKSLNRKED